MSKQRIIGLVAVAAVSLAGVAGLTDAGGRVSRFATRVRAIGPVDPTIGNCNTTLAPKPDTPITPVVAHSGMPCTVLFDPTQGFERPALQQEFDFNSWLSFIALNTPASGSPPGAPPVWEGWQDLSSVMLPGGATPPPFGTEVPAPSICTGGVNGTPVLRMISKTVVTPTVQEAGQPLNTGPLIDQNGKYVRYQILVNQPMYNYIVANHLYSKAGQAAFSGTVQFPAATAGAGTTGTMGAIVIKVAWKELGAGDDPATFQTIRGYVYNPPTATVTASCRVRTLGLVGLHIVHKTTLEPQWNWATFEHIGNVPTSPVTSGRFSFYDPHCSGACSVNAQPPQPWNSSKEPFPNGFHSQIVRKTVYPKDAVDSAARWNPQFQAALSGSVLANYELITTQWPTAAKNPVDPNGAPFPQFAANATMETYVQGNVPQASSTCMGCHGNATATNGKVSDFSFVLEKAQ